MHRLSASDDASNLIRELQRAEIDTVFPAPETAGHELTPLG